MKKQAEAALPNILKRVLLHHKRSKRGKSCSFYISHHEKQHDEDGGISVTPGKFYKIW